MGSIDENQNRGNVGLFFFIHGNFVFAGCSLSEAEQYGDFLVYSESHYHVWEKYMRLKYKENEMEVDYDFFPRGRVVYNKAEDLFIIYYDRCVEDNINRITRAYSDYHYITERDEHYCCHKCNKNYVGWGLI
ncbi:MAG: hypothetical protein ACI39H_00090 [Lachnospiraceae bacterium]